jgi:hypothetical protein
MPAAQKQPVAIESRPRRRHGIDQKPLEGAAALAREKVSGWAYSFGVRAPSLIKIDRSVKDADLA